MTAPKEAVYGTPPPGLADAGPGALQLSPLVPGADAIEALADESLASLVVAAPQGTLERRYVLAHGLRALAPGGRLVALAPKDRGGARLRAELTAFGCDIAEESRSHHRICSCVRPDQPQNLDEAIALGAPRFEPALGLFTQPGVFSWDRIDPGSRLLAGHLEALSGTGADLGAGLGVLARVVLGSAGVDTLHLVELDRRAVEAAKRSILDPRAHFTWGDARRQPLEKLDFVVSNPPFHVEGRETRALGQAFIEAAARMLRRGGELRLVANRHLPYEAVLAERFSDVTTLAERDGFKVIAARR